MEVRRVGQFEIDRSAVNAARRFGGGERASAVAMWLIRNRFGGCTPGPGARWYHPEIDRWFEWWHSHPENQPWFPENHPNREEFNWKALIGLLTAKPGELSRMRGGDKTRDGELIVQYHRRGGWFLFLYEAYLYEVKKGTDKEEGDPRQCFVNFAGDPVEAVTLLGADRKRFDLLPASEEDSETEWWYPSDDALTVIEQAIGISRWSVMHKLYPREY